MSKARLMGLMGWLLCAACQELVIVGSYDVPGAGRGGASGSGAGAGASGSAGAAGASALGSPARVNVDTPDQLSIEPGTLDEFCTGRGPAVRSQRAGADCDTRIERRLFSHALCACDELRLPGDTFLIDSYDSNQGRYVTGEVGGAIGVNGTLSALAADTRVLGSVVVAGDAALAIDSPGFAVSGDLKINAALEARSAGTRVARDLWVRGDIRAAQDAIMVGRDVYQQSGRAGGDTIEVAGQRYVVGDFSVPAPCACDPASLLDVPALVEQARTQNDNEARNFRADGFIFGSLVSERPALPCGRLFVNTIAVTGDTVPGFGISTIDIMAGQRTALFVGGNVVVQSFATLNFGTLADAGELDVFIRGDLVIETSSTVLIGGNILDNLLGVPVPPRPAAVRVYVGGNIIMRGDLLVWGQLYAPQATIDMGERSVGLEGYGSIFARSIRSLGTRRMHYDRAILQAGNECSQKAPQRCDGCHQCPGELACIAGSCGACASDSDCCSPSICSDGKCRPLPTAEP